MSLFASTMSMFESSIWKNGHSRAIACSSVMPSSGRACVHAATAAPKPNQAGSISRHCAHPNTQGIARRSSTRIDFLREAGRLPMCRLAISAITVESQKYRSNPGVSYTSAR